MNENDICSKILDAAFEIHRTLGPGLLESAYKECLYFEIKKSGLAVAKEKPIPLVYKEVKLEAGYRADLFVEDKVIVEVKSVEGLAEIHFAQMLTYTRLTQRKLGLLINFNECLLKDGIRRVANDL